MIDINNLKYDGRQRNHQNGLTFYFTKKAQVLSFLIDVIGDSKRKIKVTMHPDINHGRPHVHLNEHGASFAVDTGELLAGECDNKTCKLIKNWIERHRDDLKQLWNIIKRGEDRQPIVERIKSNKGFDEYGFKCDEPRYKTVIDGVVIWHNDELLIERNEDKRVLVIGTGELFVFIPANSDKGHFDIESVDCNVYYGRIAE